MNLKKINLKIKSLIKEYNKKHLNAPDIKGFREEQCYYALWPLSYINIGKNIPKKIVVCPTYLYYMDYIKYTSQIKRYLKYFKPEQIKIIIYEDFKNNNKQVYIDVCKFLNISTHFNPIIKVINKNKNTKYKIIYDILRASSFLSIRKFFNKMPILKNIQQLIFNIFLQEEKRVPLDNNLKKELMTKTKKEVKDLSIFLDRDLITLWGYKK